MSRIRFDHDSDDGYFDPAKAADVGSVFQLTDWSEFETEAEARAYRERLKRKKPIGFAPWPAEPKPKPRNPGKRST